MYLATELFPNPIVNEAVHNYSVEQSMPVPSNIEQHRQESLKWAEENGAEVIMFVHPLQAKFFVWFAKLLGAKKVLEIGCFTGCSALAFAEALKDVPGSEVTTLDVPGKHSDFARASIQKYGPRPDPTINLIEGRAIDTLPTLAGKQYDLIFIDADKPAYPAYLDIIMDLGLLAPGGVLLADNILRYGLVADSSSNNPNTQEYAYAVRQAPALDEFNKKVLGDPRLESVILPVFDGINFVKRKY